MNLIQRKDGNGGEQALAWPFGSLFEGFWAPQATTWAPPMDVVEAEKEYRLHLEVPGVDPKAVEITVQDGVLTVTGEKSAEKTEKGETWTRSERVYGAFTRSVTLPEGIDAEKVTAEGADGVLVVRIPKPEAKAAKKIQVNRK
jgi:HSP20 family protein